MHISMSNFNIRNNNLQGLVLIDSEAALLSASHWEIENMNSHNSNSLLTLNGYSNTTALDSISYINGTSNFFSSNSITTGNIIISNTYLESIYVPFTGLFVGYIATSYLFSNVYLRKFSSFSHLCNHNIHPHSASITADYAIEAQDSEVMFTNVSIVNSAFSRVPLSFMMGLEGQQEGRKMLCENFSLINVYATPNSGRLGSAIACDPEFVITFTNFTVSNLQGFSCILALEGNATLTGEFAFTNSSTNGVDGIYPCNSQINFDASVQSNVPGLFPVTSNDPFRCIVYVQGVPMYLQIYGPNESEPSNHHPLVWLVLGCVGVVGASLILAGFVYVKKTKSTYTTIQ